MKNNKPVDTVIKSVQLNIKEKKFVIVQILSLDKYLHLSHKLDITSMTISKLLKFKSNNKDFMDLFKIIIEASSNAIFTYEHLYHLILQIWMDDAGTSFSLCNRQILISIGLGEKIHQDFLENIKKDVVCWFCNVDKIYEITHLVNWLCTIDDSGDLTRYLNMYKNSASELELNVKFFKKISGMTPNEYQMRQRRTKKNGLCKFIRESKICPYGFSCNYYHGKIEETYGFQLCRSGNKCTRLKTSGCKFCHVPTDSDIISTKNIYGLFTRIQNNVLALDPIYEKYIDEQLINNPFCIFQKTGRTPDKVYYKIPKCECHITDEYGLRTICGKSVRFMSKNRFYCCFEHLECSKQSSNYTVKQNILRQVLFDPE